MLRHIHLQKRNPAKNQQRFYAMSVEPNLFGEWSLIRHWGRIGTLGCYRTDWHETRESATRFMNRKTAEKRRRGYS